MSEQRIDRIEVTIEANAVAIRENATAIGATRVTTQENAAAIAELRSTVNSLVQVVEIHQQNHELTQRNFEAMLTEIRGLRTDQRILEHLFGRQHNGE